MHHRVPGAPRVDQTGTAKPAAIRLIRRALGNVRQHIALPLATVTVLVAAVLAGRLSLAAGLLLNEGTALLIIANRLRLLRRGEHSG